ncbi:MAG: toprim domain-containing protein [Patescibacteria group bacterium]|mgnify:CR=1 FL=1
MNSIEKLIQIFSNFPGIGPRQARRFVYYLLTRGDNTLSELSQNIADLKKDVVMCEDCKRFYQSSRRSFSEGGERKNTQTNLCKICADENRDHSILMLVQRDADLESVEKNGGFKGIYFVLGGSVPILEKEPEKRIRVKDLKDFIEKNKNNLKEIILGVNWNPEGENTADYVEKLLKPTLEKNKVKISHLGKGLSMGSELEYTDSDTLKNALRNRI